MESGIKETKKLLTPLRKIKEVGYFENDKNKNKQQLSSKYFFVDLLLKSCICNFISLCAVIYFSRVHINENNVTLVLLNYIKITYNFNQHYLIFPLYPRHIYKTQCRDLSHG